MGAEVVQIFTQSPRIWKPTQYGPEVLDAFRAARLDHPSVTATFCHATYLINLATPDPDLAAKSRACLAANLSTATGIGADGLVLHIGSHRGSGFESALPGIAASLIEVLDGGIGTGEPGGTGTGDLSGTGDHAPCPILLENAAGTGDTAGRTFEELALVIEAAGHDQRLGVCVDTQHLWASGVPFGTVVDADALVGMVEATVGLDRLRCLHLNDSKVPFGANRDRHENIGEGTIGSEALGALLGHPALQGLPAILEVPGAGDGPRAEDIEAARQIWRAGMALRS